MIIKTLFTAALLCLFTAKLSGQQLLDTQKPSDSASIGTLALYDLKQSIRGIGYSFTRPLHWKKKDFTTLGTFVVGTLALSTIDDESSALFVKNERHVPNLFMDAGTEFGSPQVYFIANAALYGTGLIMKNEKLRKTSVLIISSSITTGVIQSIAKTAIGRARPRNVANGLNSRDFEFWSDKPEFHSFPSGHTVLSVTMAHAVAKQFNNTWSKIGVYSLGSVAPISRLFAGAHWLTDVGAATFLSIVVVDAVDNFLFKTNAYDYPKRKKQISWNFSFSGNKVGLVGTF
ncbi:phosphatase PAP2 family protein [Algibacter miyuki]|uniref:Phosphatase PAP2 family protein n=1 Tax=Algibacter miyuki TaxID=1306933 RepID=A0ABV5GZ70_9FLAO|nr:phosphatase PAP2 family protein [Algibacter miyuki]MDN3666848.1 phosphatase PAP2 family protein [Algibacter miyuki]